MVRPFLSIYLIALLIGMMAADVFAQIRVTDDLGQEIILQQPARRVISLAPNITELLFFVGAGKKIVGADEYSNYPDEAKKIQRVNNFAAANYELILSLKPDLVIAWYSGNGEQITARIRELGLPLFVIEPRKMESVPGLLVRLGELTGNRQQAIRKAETFREQLDRLKEAYSDKKKVRVFYQIWNEPLITLNGEHLVSDVIKQCGGENVFADAVPLVPYVNIEAVIRAQPEVIIASGSSEDAPQWLDMWESWPTLQAVANKQVYFIPPDLMQRHSMRILDGAHQLCGYLDNAR